MTKHLPLLLFIGMAWGQDWSLTFDQGIGRYVEQTQDGGYVIIGENNNGDAYMVKTDEWGNEIWNHFKTYFISCLLFGE